MNKPITVDEAIKKGQRMLNYPVQCILLLMLGIGFYAGTQKLASPRILLLGFVLAIVLPWLYWSIMVTKWRLWPLMWSGMSMNSKKELCRNDLSGARAVFLK
ncbi:MAG: hypothetical protein SH848_13805 [Saprospiraceae bacterium]|nr:hypothetical protein [Saprospiraceae bacterium]